MRRQEIDETTWYFAALTKTMNEDADDCERHVLKVIREQLKLDHDQLFHIVWAHYNDAGVFKGGTHHALRHLDPS